MRGHHSIQEQVLNGPKIRCAPNPVSPDWHTQEQHNRHHQHRRNTHYCFNIPHRHHSSHLPKTQPPPRLPKQSP